MLIQKTVRAAVMLFALAGAGLAGLQAEARSGPHAGFERHKAHRATADVRAQQQQSAEAYEVDRSGREVTRVRQRGTIRYVFRDRGVM